MIIGKQEFPDDCPLDCPEKAKSFFQGNLCCRCPIFNCKKVKGPDGEPFSLLEPHEYREDWAKEFKKWFDGGMIWVPHLYFQVERRNK